MSSESRRSEYQRSSHAGSSTVPNDLTWVDFLRTARGNTSHNYDSAPLLPPELLIERPIQAPRKRRYADPDLIRRNNPYPPTVAFSDASLAGLDRFDAHMSMGNGSNRGTEGGNTGSSGGTRSEVPIDFNSFSEFRLGPSFHNNGNNANNNNSSFTQLSHEDADTTRRETDIVLPRWQPDAEADKCPVCNTEFRFWYRKHHCRKCGRVVCAGCSPHRITIPRQYIVQQPPNLLQYGEDEGEQGSNSGPSDWGAGGNPALGGGETVRVCNPCVPDPWSPPAASAAIAPDVSNTRPDTLTPRRSPSYGMATVRNVRTMEPGHRPRASTISDLSQATSTPTRGRYVPHDSTGAPLYGRPSPDRGTRPQDTHPDHDSVFFPEAFQDSTRRRPAPVPRRQVKEEDECPVCGMEMPVGESIRERHIQDCIETRFSATQNPPGAAPPQAANTTVAASTADAFARAAGASLPAALASGSRTTAAVVPGGPSRPRATSYRPRGMALYKATEKDCMTEEGETQECIICFEDFQPGDELGRMECLCKFHRHCIRQWWETKGQGSCPTHQLHD